MFEREREREIEGGTRTYMMILIHTFVCVVSYIHHSTICLQGIRCLRDRKREKGHESKKGKEEHIYIF